MDRNTPAHPERSEARSASRSRRSNLRALLALILFPLVALSSACSIYGYERGTVKRVDVKKAITEPVVQASAGWAPSDAGVAWRTRMASRGVKSSFAASATGKAAGKAAGAAAGTAGGAGAAGAGPVPTSRAILVTLARRSRVDLERTRSFNTIEWESHGDGLMPMWEVLEFVTSPLYMILLPPLVALGVGMPYDSYFQFPFRAKLMVATAVLNPCVTIFGTTLNRNENIEEIRFREAPVKLAYGTRFPLSEVKFSYRVLGPDGKELGRGETRTDVFGEAYLEGAAGASKVEITGEGVQASVSL